MLRSDAGPPPISVVGVVGGETFGTPARRAVDDADVVVASGRHLTSLAGVPGGDVGSARPEPAEVIDLAGPLAAVLDRIDDQRGRGCRVCIVASGDPGFFGIVRALGERFGPDALVVHPAPSSVALAFATQGWTWDDAVVASAHGRALGPTIAAVGRSAKAAVLTDPTNTPEVVGAALAARGVDRTVVVVSRIGEADERCVRTDVAGLAAGCFDPLSVVLLVAPDGHVGALEGSDRATGTAGTTSATGGAGVAEAPTVSWGRDEHRFAHRDGMITKAEVRAVALGKLSVPARGVLWDVGAGSGSVGIEAAALAPALEVIAVEHDPRDAERIVANATDHLVDIRVVTGAAPGALADLPDPDRVFIGGGGIDVLDACLARLRPAGVVVATYVLLDRALAAHGRLGNMIQVRIDRCVPLGGGVRMEPLNPVFVCWGPP